MTEQEFSGKTALVTGGSRGIGRACAEMLARHGARVAVNYRSNANAANDVVRTLQTGGHTAIAVRADVSDETQVQTMVETVEKQLGPVDLLINNAGVFYYATHEETDLELWNRTLACNLTGVFLVTWAVKQQMIERQFGRIVNMSSISALRPRPNSIAYAASKAGVTGFTKSTAEAFAEHNIRVNAIAPGLIETEILDGVDQSVLDRIVESTPLGRIGTPDDVAELARFLLSDESRFMTGQTIVGSGGSMREASNFETSPTTAGTDRGHCDSSAAALSSATQPTNTAAPAASRRNETTVTRLNIRSRSANLRCEASVPSFGARVETQAMAENCKVVRAVQVSPIRPAVAGP